MIKYRNESTRLKGWDYSSNGLYFITICIVGHECILGYIENAKMYLSEIGKIVYNEWHKSFKIRTELFCDSYIIMPNHIHAILRIDIQQQNVPEINTQKQNGIAYRPPKSISSFVAGFKSAATTQINQYRKTPKMRVWQYRFHDHIIRNDSSYQRIKQYIENNPADWKGDKFYQ